MGVDYKELCKRLFGTTDVGELEVIATKVKTKNDRGAGRKPKFSKSEVYYMKALHQHGLPVRDIADGFGTSRQTVYKYLSATVEKPANSFDDILDMVDDFSKDERESALRYLLSELKKGITSGEKDGFISSRDIRERFRLTEQNGNE